MTGKIFKATVLAVSMLLVWPCANRPAQAQDAKAPYPAMAALDQYLMADRDAEIALAKSAAPPALSSDANVLVLEKVRLLLVSALTWAFEPRVTAPL